MKEVKEEIGCGKYDWKRKGQLANKPMMEVESLIELAVLSLTILMNKSRREEAGVYVTASASLGEKVTNKDESA